MKRCAIVLAFLTQACQSSEQSQPTIETQTKSNDQQNAQGETADVQHKGPKTPATQASLTFAGPFSVGDGTLRGVEDDDGPKREGCFRNMNIPASQQTDRVVKIGLHIEGVVGKAKIRLKSCGSSMHFWAAEAYLYKDGAMVAELGRISEANDPAILTNKELTVAPSDGSSRLETGDYSIVISADEGNDSVPEKSGGFEDMAIKDVEFVMVSGDAELTKTDIILSSSL